ncbi:MAG TPA: hypothetical protein VGR81_09470 [Candidatus Acidoferrales bacterium]|nr:hypothetical protein [Candidatus Acidoferrales bacterium]
MSDLENPQRARSVGKRSYEDNVPPPRILKIALLAAAAIVIIALILYFKARHAPPALKNQLQTNPSQIYARSSLCAPGPFASDIR